MIKGCKGVFVHFKVSGQTLETSKKICQRLLQRYYHFLESQVGSVRKMQQICIFVTKQNMSRMYAFLVYFDSDKSDLIQASRQKNVAKDPVKNILVTVMV